MHTLHINYHMTHLNPKHKRFNIYNYHITFNYHILIIPNHTCGTRKGMATYSSHLGNNLQKVLRK
jgi:hypothetical protein